MDSFRGKICRRYPCTKLQLHAKCQMYTVCSFWTIAWRCYHPAAFRLSRFLVQLRTSAFRHCTLHSARQHPSYGGCLEVQREYYPNSSILDCVTLCSQSAAHLYQQFYRSNRLGLSHWDPYTVRRDGCLELYYCHMVEWFWWDSSLISTTNWFSSVLWHCWFCHLACKNHPRNDLLCVKWDVKPYTLTHYVTASLQGNAALKMTLVVIFLYNSCTLRSNVNFPDKEILDMCKSFSQASWQDLKCTVKHRCDLKTSFLICRPVHLQNSWVNFTYQGNWARLVNPFSPVSRICRSAHNPGRRTYTSWHHWFEWSNYTRPDCKCSRKQQKRTVCYHVLRWCKQ